MSKHHIYPEEHKTITNKRMVNIMEKGQIDYDKLVGKEVVAKYAGDIVLVVTGIDPEVGITMYRKDDDTEPAMCLVSPEIHLKKQRIEKSKEELDHHMDIYRRDFDHHVEGIVAGVLDEEWREEDIKLACEYHNETPGQVSITNMSLDTNELCAFR